MAPEQENREHSQTNRSQVPVRTYIPKFRRSTSGCSKGKPIKNSPTCDPDNCVSCGKRMPHVENETKYLCTRCFHTFEGLFAMSCRTEIPVSKPRRRILVRIDTIKHNEQEEKPTKLTVRQTVYEYQSRDRGKCFKALQTPGMFKQSYQESAIAPLRTLSAFDYMKEVGTSRLSNGSIKRKSKSFQKPRTLKSFVNPRTETVTGTDFKSETMKKQDIDEVLCQNQELEFIINPAAKTKTIKKAQRNKGKLKVKGNTIKKTSQSVLKSILKKSAGDKTQKSLRFANPEATYRVFEH